MTLLGHWRFGRFRGLNALYFFEGSLSLQEISMYKRQIRNHNFTTYIGMAVMAGYRGEQVDKRGKEVSLLGQGRLNIDLTKNKN